jgi:hypothetical protein
MLLASDSEQNGRIARSLEIDVNRTSCVRPLCLILFAVFNIAVLLWSLSSIAAGYLSLLRFFGLPNCRYDPTCHAQAGTRISL